MLTVAPSKERRGGGFSTNLYSALSCCTSVVAMLLELVHSYTSVVLKDALVYSRMRQLRRRGPTDLTTVGSSHVFAHCVAEDRSGDIR